jgi:hypothetical protein
MKKQIIRLTENDVRQMVKQTAMRILREEAIRRATKRAMNEVRVSTPDGDVELHGSWNDAPGIDGRNGRRDATEDEKLNAGKSWAFMRGLRVGREGNYEDMDGMSMNPADKDRFDVDREINNIASESDLNNANYIFDDYVGDEPEEPDYELVRDEDNPMEKRRKMMRNDRKRQEDRNAMGEYRAKADTANTARRDSMRLGALTGKSMLGSMKDKYGAS